MRVLPSNLKPRSGYSYYLHFVLTLLLPISVYVFVEVDWPAMALTLILLSKWRMFVMRPRFWLANLRSNAVDIMAGLSFLAFMDATDSDMWKLIWMGLYVLWLIVIKPGSSTFMVALQAFVAQTLALMALFLRFADAPLYALVLATWLVGYLVARHFLTGFDEPHAPLYAATWSYFCGALTWVLGHWLLFYGLVAQPTLLLTVLGFGLAGMYYLQEHDKLSDLLRRQFIFIMVAIVVVVFVFSNWGDKNI